MTWFQLLQLLQLLRNCLPEPNPLVMPSAPVADDQLRPVLERMELDERLGTDAAVRAFSRSGALPALSPNERYFLACRLEFASWLVIALNAPDEEGERKIVPDPSPDWEREDEVEWMLIWAWRTPGVKVWLEKTLTIELLKRRSSPPPG